MRARSRVGIVGDFNPDNETHRATERSRSDLQSLRRMGEERVDAPPGSDRAPLERQGRSLSAVDNADVNTDVTKR